MARSSRSGKKTTRRKSDRRDDRRRYDDRPRGGFFQTLFKLFVVCLMLGGAAVGGFLLYASRDLPDLAGLHEIDRQPSVAYLDRNGGLIGRRGDTQRAVRIGDLPPYLPRAVMAVEDRKFRYHPGVDPFGVARAAYANYRAGRVVQGGSTITQQLAKNLFLTNERTFKRKAQEAVLALWLERKFSKDEILELYLNRVYFGAGAWGVEAASRRYFGKSASEVSLGEAALLAGLLKAPSRYNPSSDVARAEGRATVVLDVMVEAGEISAEDREEAFNAPIVVTRGAAASSAHYFMDWMDVQLHEILGEIDQDLIVDTTLDLNLQRAAEAGLQNGLDEDAIAAGATQGAAVALDPEGGVMAMAGGRAYDESQFNRAVNAHRQPGSSFKSFVYLAAFERGLAPNTVRNDAPVRVGDYAPGNYNNKYEGAMTLRRAYEKSSNSIAVSIASEVGIANVAATARRMGITSPLRNEAALALGAQEVTPLELASAYAPFANGGNGVIPHGVTRIRTPDGEVLYERRGSGPGPVMEAREWRAMQELMHGVVTRGTGRRAQIEGRDVGGKTGTTDNFRDAWFAGFTEGVTAVVWIGDDDFRQMKQITGGTKPAEIWASIMASAPVFEIAPPSEPEPEPISLDPEAEAEFWENPDAAAGPEPGIEMQALPPVGAARNEAPPEDDPIGALLARMDG